MANFRDKANLIWSMADLLRGRYKQADYGKVILPFAVLRRLDFALALTKNDAFITVLNEKFGTDFNEADKYFFDSIEEELYLDDDLKKRSLNNPLDSFKYAFEEVFINRLKIYGRFHDSTSQGWKQRDES